MGLKTGYTEKAGRTLVSAARREGTTLICVTLNAPSDWADHTALLDWGFANYESRPLAEAGKVIGQLPVTGGLSPGDRGGPRCRFGPWRGGADGL